MPSVLYTTYTHSLTTMAVLWAVLGPFPLFLSFLIACLYGVPVVAQYNKATTTDAAGDHVWTPLPNGNPLSVVTV
jgi:hypothetical protein